MIKVENTLFKTVQHFMVEAELDTTYFVEVEKSINGSTEYECTCRAYIDPDTKEKVVVADIEFSEYSDQEKLKHRTRMEMVEDTVLNHVKRHGIGTVNKEDR
jgi:hypothetical protein